MIPIDNKYYFYIIRCSDDSLYCGQTTDLVRRVDEHNLNDTKGSKYTRTRRPVRLVYHEEFVTMSLAMKREAEVKKWPKVKKETLVSRLR